MLTPCSCGTPEPHVIVRRTTADGVLVSLWSDGDITARLGTYPPGMGRFRSPSDAAVEAGRRIMAKVCLYDWAELAPLIREERRGS